MSLPSVMEPAATTTWPRRLPPAQAISSSRPPTRAAITFVINGTVNTGTGAIELDADDAVTLSSGTIGGTVNGQTFMGTVLLDVNMDLGNAQVLTMSAGTAITTGSILPNAVTLNDFDTADGVNTIGNITVGNGGGINLNAAESNAGFTLLNTDGRHRQHHARRVDHPARRHHAECRRAPERSTWKRPR